jgi:hypothetical protein
MYVRGSTRELTMATVPIVLTKAKKHPIPKEWKHEVIAKVRDAGDSRLFLQKLLIERWAKLAPAWDAGAELSLLVTEDEVQYEFKVPAKADAGEKKTIKDAIGDLTVLFKGKTPSSGFAQIDASTISTDAERLAAKGVVPEKKKKTPVTEVVVFAHPNLVNVLTNKAQLEALGLEELPLEVKIDANSGGKKVLERLAQAEDLPYVLMQIKDAGDFGALVRQVDTLVAKMAKDTRPVGPRTAAFNAEFEDICKEAANRALTSVKHFHDVKYDYGSYQVKSGVKLTLAVSGVAVGIAGLASTPFTGGASGVLGIIGVIKGGLATVEQVVNLVREAEGINKDLVKMLEELESRYAHGVLVITANELTIETVAAAVSFPLSVVSAFTPVFATLKQCKEKLDLMTAKTNGLEVDTQLASKSINYALKGVNKLEKQLGVWMAAEGDALKKSPKKLKKLKEMVAGIQGAQKAVTEALDATIICGERMSAMRKNIDEMKAKFDPLDEKEPKIVKVLAVVIPQVVNLAVSAGGTVPSPSGLAYASNGIDGLTSAFTGFEQVFGDKV